MCDVTVTTQSIERDICTTQTRVAAGQALNGGDRSTGQAQGRGASRERFGEEKGARVANPRKKFLGGKAPRQLCINGWVVSCSSEPN